MHDPTEKIRREMVGEINAVEGSREHLEAQHGEVWSTEELAEDFEVCGFLAPFVEVKRKEDGARGTMLFQHSPRFYFKFEDSA